jgi:hypothetical protein
MPIQTNAGCHQTVCRDSASKQYFGHCAIISSRILTGSCWEDSQRNSGSDCLFRFILTALVLCTSEQIVNFLLAKLLVDSQYTMLPCHNFEFLRSCREKAEWRLEPLNFWARDKIQKSTTVLLFLCLLLHPQFLRILHIELGICARRQYFPHLGRPTP